MKRGLPVLAGSRSLLAVLFTIVLAWGGIAWGQSDYPTRTIRIIVPYTPGGTNDVLTRFYAKGLTDLLGQQFIIDNRPGGGTNIAAEVGARSAPDGYTLFVVQAASHGINPSLYGKLAYDPVKDFSAAGFMARTAMFLVINPALPVSSVQELVNYARANPGKLILGSAGNGSPNHLAGALLMQRTGIDVVHVPYKGVAQALGDLVGGQVQFAFVSFDGLVSNLARDGKLKALAVAAATRWPTELQIPTMSESGMPNFEVLGFFGLSAPARTPEPILEKLNHAMADISKREETGKRIAEMGLVPMSGTRNEMTAFIINEIEKWRPIVKASGAKVE